MVIFMPLHNQSHPNVHQEWKQWSEEQILHTAVCYINPRRYHTRRKLANNCILHLRNAANVKLYVAEVAYGGRPFEVTGSDPLDVQLRTNHELWHKENALNIAISHFPQNWKYGAYVDADFVMTRHDWALEAIHLLQHYDFVQLFSSYTCLSSEYRPHSMLSGFVADYLRQQNKTGLPEVAGESQHFRRLFTKDKPNPFPECYGEAFTSKGIIKGSPGGAWAFRRSAFETVGGLLDVCIVGAGDHYAALGLIGSRALKRTLNDDLEVERNPGYFKAITAWQDRATSLKFNIGALDNHAIHHWHGAMAQRAYGTRWRILTENNFDPVTDLSKDWQGLWQLTPDKPKLRDDLRNYFMFRNEDNPNLGPTERHLV